MLLTISNLYPRPDELRRGLFNAQLFDAMNEQVADMSNICLVPSWHIWKYKNIYSWMDSYSSVLETKYVPYIYIPIVGRNYSWFGCRHSLDVHRYLFERCNVVLATWLYPDCVAVVELAKKYNKPAWLKVHGSDRFHLQNNVRRKLILNACEYACGVICNAEFMKNELINLGVTAEKLHVVPNGVDSSIFTWRSKNIAVSYLKENRQKEIIKDIIANKSKVVLFVGNLVDIKGLDILLDAWGNIKQNVESSTRRLVVIGNGSSRKAFKAQSIRLGIDDSVSFIGSCSHDDVAHWMNIADCLCLPSRSEGMPNVVFEAFASGLPVVATDVGDCRDVFEEAGYVSKAGADIKHACIVPIENAGLLADGICEVLSQDYDRKMISQKWRDRLSWQKCAEQHVKLLHG